MILTLKSIICLETTIEPTDEPYLLISADGDAPEHWGPFSMRQGDSRNIDMSIPFDRLVTIQLMESDSSSLTSSINDVIGDFEVSSDHPRGAFTITLPQMSGDGLVGVTTRDPFYTISYDVTRDAGDRLDQWNLGLISIRCNDAQEATDEAYITVDERRVWGPRNMKSRETESIGGAPIIVSTPVVIEVWEEDAYNSENIGTHTINITDRFAFGETQRHTFSRDRGIVGDASYTLTYTITER